MNKNPFESGARKMIPAVLIYVRSGDEVLMLHRGARPGDEHSGKWNGLGGKCEADESFLEAARRELREESNLDLPSDAFQFLGTLHFPNFKPHKSEDWMVSVYVARVAARDRGAVPLSGPEGDLQWIPTDDVLALNLWEGDRHFIPLVLRERAFHGTIWYRDGVVARWEIAEIS